MSINGFCYEIEEGSSSDDLLGGLRSLPNMA